MTGDLQRFGALLHQRFGLRPDPARESDLASAFATRLAATGLSPEGYLAALADPARAAVELRAIAALVTIGESYFFRHPDQFRALAEVVLPERLRANPGKVRVLSAGCSGGDEPYSVAILCDERGLGAHREIEILGVDLNHEAVTKARSGRYTAWSMRGVPAELQQRYFKRDGAAFVLDPAIQRRVGFQERNLTQPDPLFWAAGAFDVIVCRNVLIYFDVETIRGIIARFAHALAPGGYLILGPSETLRGISDDFHLLHTHGAFYYQRKGAPAGAPRDLLPVAAASPPLGRAWTLPEQAPVSDAWADEITRAAGRIASLGSPAQRPPSDAGELLWKDALAAFQAERFAEALSALDALPEPRGSGREAGLLRAAILTNAGQLEAAERACRNAIDRDELDPGAHYLLALCRDQAGDLPAAKRHDEAALHLDPGFAMPQLHLGLLARREGNGETARSAFERALALLDQEPEERLALFGGGFGRGMLLALVRGELAKGGGA